MREKQQRIAELLSKQELVCKWQWTLASEVKRTVWTAVDHTLGCPSAVLEELP